MAKHVILESYAFTPASKQIVVTGKAIRKEQLLLITNTTTGTVIYNFSDSALTATSHTTSVDTTTGQETTTIVLSYNTASMSSTDKLAILVEETYHEITPSETMRDPVDKMRVSTPQSLIDTDFEYGQQPTKWESMVLMNNRPSAFADPTQGISNTARIDMSFYNSGIANNYTISNISASGNVVTVAMPVTTGLTNGTPIFVQGTLDPNNADGWWVIDTVTGNTNFTYTSTGTPNTGLFDANKSYVFPGQFFTGAAIPLLANTTAITLSGTVGTVTTVGDHGLQPGNDVFIVGTSGASANLNRSWTVLATPTSSTFTFTCNLTGTVTSTTTSLYARPLGYVQHRAFDGGVQFSNVKPYHGYQVFRQTRRQFRYQSGKGIQFSTGTIMKPALAVDQIVSSGNTITVTTKQPHGLLPGAVIKVSGATDSAYNGNTFTVATAANNSTLTYTSTTPGSSPAVGFPLVVSPASWYGAFNRVGMFDNQNGFFFEYDGQTLYVCRRNSTAQCSGNISVTNGSASVTGSSTAKFSSELKPGDYVVIRGMSYLVQTITSDTQMYIYPEYRGVTAPATVLSKTQTVRYAQSTWNIDRCDGTGASGFNVDLTKMQMFYADFTWYGAGGIRFGFKNNRGEIIYCHRIPNNNVNTEAYMRSGNLVARYEIDHKPYYTNLTATLANTATTGATISVADASTWAPSGNVLLRAASSATGNPIEIISYSARTNTALTIASRTITGGTATVNTFTYSATAPILAQQYSPQVAATISHWGSSVIMDGRFDDDKSFVFNAGYNTPLSNLVTTARTPIISIRLAPSVDNGLTGLLGSREILNRMQLTLRSMDVYAASAAFKIELILNGRVSAGTFTPVGGSSLAQVAYHANTATITGGESIYGFFTSKDSATSQDLNQVRDIGNSILGGGTSLTCPTTPANMYPDGPDIITICATAITSATNTLNARISWTEAQA